MAAYTPREAKANYLMVMGEELGPVYHHLWQELGHIHFKWREYVELYGTNQARFDIMTEAAPSFFHRLVNRVLLESVMIHIARLTDPPETPLPKGPPRQDLTIKRLPPLIDDKKLRTKVNKAIGTAEQACKFARDWRNRQIAHGDLSLAMDDSPPVPVEPPSRLKVRKALEALTKAMNVVSQHYANSTNIFDDGPIIGGALQLLHTLRNGNEAHRAKTKRLKAGKPEPEDIGPPPPL